VSKKPVDRDRGERFRYLREEVLGIQSQDQFAKDLGVERGAVGNWELGGGVKMENLTKIASTYRVPLEWLAYGRGERPVPGDVVPGRKYITEDEINRPPALTAQRAYAREHYKATHRGGLPELDVKLGAGEGKNGEILSLPIGSNAYSGHRVVAEWLLPETFVRTEARASTIHTVILPVTGDSMLPNYNYGDRVLVDLAQNIFMQDGVYAISDGQTEPRIKRLQYVFNSNPRRVRIISDNPIYAPEELLLDEVTIIGRVCGVIARR
jgi:phage repressor protein C with HTH and peptisase S24 domain